MEADLPQARSPLPCARMKVGVILRVSKHARMGIEGTALCQDPIFKRAVFCWTYTAAA